MTTIDIAARQGDTLHVELSFDAGSPAPETPYPAADYDVSFWADWYDGGELLLDGTAGGITLVDANGGGIAMDVAAEVTATLPPGRVARYQVTLIHKTQETVVTVFDGYLDVTERLVRP